MRTTPNPAFARFVLIGTLCVSIASCGGNGDGGGGSPVVPGEQEATKTQIENIENKDAKNR